MKASYLGQSHANATAGGWPYLIAYPICLCGHLGGVCEIQTSFDVSDLFKSHEELTSCSALKHSYLLPLLDVL